MVLNLLASQIGDFFLPHPVFQTKMQGKTTQNSQEILYSRETRTESRPLSAMPMKTCSWTLQVLADNGPQICIAPSEQAVQSLMHTTGE